MKNKKEKVEEKQNLCTVGIKNDAAWYFVAQYLYLLDHFRIDDDEFTRLYQALSKYVDDKVNAFPNGDILRHRGVKPHKRSIPLCLTNTS